MNSLCGCSWIFALRFINDTQTHSASVALGLVLLEIVSAAQIFSFQLNQRVILLCGVELLNIPQDDRCVMRFLHGLQLCFF